MTGASVFRGSEKHEFGVTEGKHHGILNKSYETVPQNLTLKYVACNTAGLDGRQRTRLALVDHQDSLSEVQ